MDSTKVEIISKSLDKLATKLSEQTIDKPSIWNTIIPILIGAGLTLLTQLIIEIWKSKKNKYQKLQELISKGRAKTYLIAQVLKDLAMYKAHKQYYIRAYELGTDEADREDSYKKHYEKGQEQRLTEARLDDIIADYFQLVTEYTIVTKQKDDFQNHFQKIFHYIHPKASKFKDCGTLTELVSGLEKEENRLNEEYKRFFEIFEAIQTSMK